MSKRKGNVSFTRPEDPAFLKALKKQVGYDDTNHKFDSLQNAEEDFVNDNDDEAPQVVVVKSGDLTADEAEIEKQKIEKAKVEEPADLTQRVIFKSKKKTDESEPDSKRKKDSKISVKSSLLSFGDEEDDDDDNL